LIFAVSIKNNPVGNLLDGIPLLMAAFTIAPVLGTHFQCIGKDLAIVLLIICGSNNTSFKIDCSMDPATRCAVSIPTSSFSYSKYYVISVRTQYLHGVK